MPPVDERPEIRPLPRIALPDPMRFRISPEVVQNQNVEIESFGFELADHGFIPLLRAEILTALLKPPAAQRHSGVPCRILPERRPEAPRAHDRLRVAREDFEFVRQIESQNQCGDRKGAARRFVPFVTDIPAEIVPVPRLGVKFIEIEFMIFRFQFESHPASVFLTGGEAPGRRRHQAGGELDRFFPSQIVSDRKGPVRPRGCKEPVAEQFRAAPQIEVVRKKDLASCPFRFEFNPVGIERQSGPDRILTAEDQFHFFSFAAAFLRFLFENELPRRKLRPRVRRENQIRIRGPFRKTAQYSVPASEKTGVAFRMQVHRSVVPVITAGK